MARRAAFADAMQRGSAGRLPERVVESAGADRGVGADERAAEAYGLVMTQEQVGAPERGDDPFEGDAGRARDFARRIHLARQWAHLTVLTSGEAKALPRAALRQSRPASGFSAIPGPNLATRAPEPAGRAVLAA